MKKNLVLGGREALLLKQTKKWWGKMLDMVKQKKLACKLVRY